MACARGADQMKILCLSLLRLGDIIQHRQLVRSVMAKHPEAEIHLLCHSQFAQVEDLFAEPVKFHFIPYQDLQKILVERGQNPQAAFELLDHCLGKIKAEKFSLVYDLTHTFLSDAIRKALAIPSVKPQALWKTYLEDHATITAGSRFHLIEILARSLGLEIAASVKSSAAREKIIVLQTLTSDQKKNWSLSSFQKLVTCIEQELPEYQIQILSSPNEQEQLLQVFGKDLLFVSTMKQAQDLLRRASLLISLDTSLLHLAAQEDCPTVGLFLGGADPRKTGPLLSGALLLHGKSSCAPCSHSNPCPQPRHFCEELISVDQVFLALKHQLGKDSNMLAAERVVFQKNAYSLRNMKATPGSLDQAFEEIIWRYYLDGAWQEELPRVNSQVRQFLTENSQASPEMKLQFIRRQKTLAGEFQLCLETLEDAMKKISFLCIGQFEQQTDQVNTIRQDILGKLFHWTQQFAGQQDLFHRLQLTLENEVASAFELYRRLKSPFEEFQCLTVIRNQFADHLSGLRGEQDGKGEIKWTRPTPPSLKD
jgi:ADP-heptose:LPS heptosyltransferase